MKLFAAFVCVALSSIQAAAATPPALVNKSIQISVPVNLSAKVKQTGEVRQVSGAIRQTIYVSSAGRAFVRQTSSSVLAVRSSDMPVASSASVSGRRMVVPVPLVNGRAAVTIYFDPQFSSCTAQGSASPGRMSFVGSTGTAYEAVTPPSFGSGSCTITQGNAFGG